MFKAGRSCWAAALSESIEISGRLFQCWKDAATKIHLKLWDEYRPVPEFNDERLDRLQWQAEEPLTFEGLHRKVVNPPHIQMEAALLLQGNTVSASKLQGAMPPVLQQRSATQRVYEAVAGLREIASIRAHPDMRDYSWGLLCQTLFVATLRHLPEEAGRRAQLSAALICERLGNGRRLRYPWPPADLLAFSPSVSG